MWEAISSPLKAFLEPIARALGEAAAKNRVATAILAFLLIATGGGFAGRNAIMDALQSMQNTRLSFSEAERQLLLEHGDGLANRLRDAYALRGKPKYEAWTVAQIVIALRDHVGTQHTTIDTAEVMRFFAEQKDSLCHCWRRFNSLEEPANIAASSWVLFAKARLGQAADEDEIRFLLDSRKADGWWPIYPTNGESVEVASVYATSWAVLALHEQQALGKIPPAFSEETRRAIESGGTWLLAKKIKDTPRWNAYPLSTSQKASGDTVGVSGVAMYALHRIGASTGELDREWLGQLPPRMFAGNEVAGALEFVTDIKRFEKQLTPAQSQLLDRKQDGTHYLLAPWLLVGTVMAYPTGSLLERWSAIRMRRRFMERCEQFRYETLNVEAFMQAEILWTIDIALGSSK